MNFSPKIGVIFSAFAVIISVIAFLSPTAFPSYVPIAVATAIISTCAFLNIILNAVNGVLHLYSSSAPGPLAPKDSALVAAATKLQANDAVPDPALKVAATTLVAAAAKTASALLVGAMVVGALALGSPSTARAADSVKPGAPMTLPIDPLGLNSKTGKAAPLTGNVLQDAVTFNQALLANVVSQLKVVADQFSGDADAAIQAALSEPNPDGNGYACWTQAKAFTSVYAAHPAALTGQAMTDQEYLRKMLIAANQLCASEACKAVSNEQVAQVAKVATLANVAGIGGVVGSAAGAVAAMSATNNPFTLVCSYITPISVVAPPAGAAAAVSTPTPTPTATGN
jgi:hypothetical protein